MKHFALVMLILCLLGPVIVYLAGGISLLGDYRTANRDSAHIAPIADVTPEAIVQVYMARAFNWNGLFSVHTWIATKLPHAPTYVTYQVIGWRKLRGLDPLLIQKDIPDRNWFNAKPVLILDLHGKAAEEVIPQIEQLTKAYPYAHEYHLWPGPNSNTFTATILRQIPSLHVAMPSNAVGKDYLGGLRILAVAPSHTGYQISLLGIFGIMLAKVEGLEINVFGLVFGIHPSQGTIKLPGLGEIHLWHSA